MSTIMYLRCVSHDPYIESDEVGHVKADLLVIRNEIRGRDRIVDYMRTLLSNDDFADNIGSLRQRNMWEFLYQHPHCDLEIWDEYGREYSMEDTVDEKPISTDTVLGKIKMVIENEDGIFMRFEDLTPEGKRIIRRMTQA